MPVLSEAFDSHMTQATLDQLQTVRDFIRWGASRFNQAGLIFGHGTDNALDEAASLILHTLHLPYDLPDFYLEARLVAEEKRAVAAVIERRIETRNPAAYLTREAFLCGLKFYVDERVLVPRSPIGELLEGRFSPWLDGVAVERVLDLCTGSGCIAICCAHAFPEAQVDAVDISPSALEVAKINIRRHDMEGRVRPIQSDLFEQISGRYALIVSNPPYVSRPDWEAAAPEFKAEPKLGLESGPEGLDCVIRILDKAADHLTDDGILVVEVGNSAEALRRRYPQVPFLWMEFERGGEGVFLLTAEDLRRHYFSR
ncbi:MAG: 50S ribosomal protein L3 N(5)-glutamine methyltransferase [Methylohalobius sp. ZOD2]